MDNKKLNVKAISATIQFLILFLHIFSIEDGGIYFLTGIDITDFIAFIGLISDMYEVFTNIA